MDFTFGTMGNHQDASFDPESFERVFWQACFDAGEAKTQDEYVIRSYAQEALEILAQTSEVFTTPQLIKSATDVLRAHGLQSAARLFEKHYLSSSPSMPSSYGSSEIPSTPPIASVPASSASGMAGEPYTPRRRRLNEERKAITHKFQLGTLEGYLTVGLYDDGQPGEIFLNMNKDGSMVSGLMDAVATSISIGLQYGVPLKILVKKFINMSFEPAGTTQNPNIPEVKSVMDYVGRWLALKFLTPEDRQSVGLYATEDASRQSSFIDHVSRI